MKIRVVKPNAKIKHGLYAIKGEESYRAKDTVIIDLDDFDGFGTEITEALNFMFQAKLKTLLTKHKQCGNIQKT